MVSLDVELEQAVDGKGSSILGVNLGSENQNVKIIGLFGKGLGEPGEVIGPRSRLENLGDTPAGLSL